MRKIFTALLLIAVMAVWTVLPCFADSSTVTSFGGSTTISVGGEYVQGASSANIISVDITWGAMVFVYTSASQGTWNPDTHQYENATEAGWTAKNGDNKITITSHSNVSVTANLSFTPAVNGVIGSFSRQSVTFDAVTSDISFEEAPSINVTFNIIGGQIQSNTTLGTITVTIVQS